MSGNPTIIPSSFSPSPTVNLLHDKKVSCCSAKPLYIALFILGVLGLGAAGVGVAGFGASQAWWTAGALSHLGQLNAIIMMAAGGGLGVIFTTVGIVGSVLNYIAQLKQKHLEKLEKLQKGHEKSINPKEQELSVSKKQIEKLKEQLSAEQEKRERAEEAIKLKEVELNKIHEEELRQLEEKHRVAKETLENTLSKVTEAKKVMDTSTKLLEQKLEKLEPELKLKEEEHQRLVEEHQLEIKGLKLKLEEASKKEEPVIVKEPSEENVLLRQELEEKEKALLKLTEESKKFERFYEEYKLLLQDLESKKDECIRLTKDKYVLEQTLSRAEKLENSGSLEDSWMCMSIISLESLIQVGKAWDLFSYDKVAQHKYQVVLDEYVRHLPYDILKMKTEIEEMLRTEEHVNNQMLIHFQKMLDYLMNPTTHGPRASYQYMVIELRSVILSAEYKKLSGSSTKLEKEVRKFVHDLCIIRWKGTHLFNYLKDTVQITTEEKLPKLELKTFPETVLEVNAEVKKSKRNKKSDLALKKQMFFGAIGVKDFCGTENTPNVRCIQYFQTETGKIIPVTYARHGSPTALGHEYWSIGITGRILFGGLFRGLGFEMDTGEEVTPDYKEYLRALEERGESELFCVHQRRTPNALETERTRVMKIDGLQKDHTNIFVLTQPVEGDLFERKGKYSGATTFKELKEALDHEFFETDPEALTTRAALPQYILENKERKTEYRVAFNKLLDDVHEIFFPKEKDAVKMNSSVNLSSVEKELAKAYQTQATSILKVLSSTSLNDLEKVENPQLDEQILIKLSEDEKLRTTLEASILGQIKTLEQLQKWIAIDNDEETTVKKHLENPVVMQAVMLAVLSSAAEKALGSDKSLEKLEKQKAELLTKWQSFILLAYAFQKMDLKARLNGVRGFTLSAYTTPCKDFLDRGGNMAFVEDRLIHYILGVEKDEKRMKEALVNLLGPPPLVKKKYALVHRIHPGMEVENLLASMGEEARKRLAAYAFGKEGETLKIVGLETPRVAVQSGIPSLKNALKEAIATALPEEAEEKEPSVREVVSVIQKHAGADFGQWESFDLESSEKVYIESKAFDSEKVKKQVARDIQPGGGVKHELITSTGVVEVKEYETVMEQLLAHPLIKGDEQKALKVLSSFHQTIGFPIQISIRETMGSAIEGMEALFALKQRIAKEKEVVRRFKLDLRHADRIVFRYSDIYDMPNTKDSKVEISFKGSARVLYTAGPEDSLQSNGVARWSVKA